MTSTDNHWSDDIEIVLKSIHVSCLMYARNHRKRYFYLKGYLKYFRIPTIVISGVNSVCSVGLQPYVAQEHISILTCALALICGIIASIESYLQIQASTESDLIAAKDFQLLAADIYKMLTLDRANRGVSGISYLDEKFGIYCKFIEASQPHDKNIRDFMHLDPEKKMTYVSSGYTTDQSDGGEDSMYTSARRRSAAIALGMTEPIMSALRLSSSGSSVSSSSSLTQPTHQNQNNTENRTCNPELSDAEIELNNQHLLDSLSRIYQSESRPADNITIDLESGQRTQ
jgi:hypothetical protein